MTVHEKIHTIEISEQELARVLFVMRNANGREDYGRSITSLAAEKLGAEEIGFDVLHPKAMDLAKRAKIPTFINYFEIQKEWESFLGIGDVVKEKDILNKIVVP